MKDKIEKYIYYKNTNGILYNGNSLKILKLIPDESIDCIITSPPYYGLRFYGNESNTIWGGNENCNHEFDNNIINIKLSMSDKSKLCSGKGANPKQKNLDGEYITGYCKKCGAWYGQLGLEPNLEQYINNLIEIFKECQRVLKKTGTLWVNIGDSYKNKSLLMIPERFAIKMIKELGFYLRNKIIWHKTNAMPESVKDRFTKSYEFVYFFTKSKKYYFNQIKEPAKRAGEKNRKTKGHHEYAISRIIEVPKLKNKRDVWNIATKGFRGEHFAPFPVELVENCILAGCPKNGIVMDPFMGSGTTAVAAEKLGRKWIGIEINNNYCNIIINRLKKL